MSPLSGADSAALPPPSPAAVVSLPPSQPLRMAAAAAPPPHKMARAPPLQPPQRHGFLGAAGEGRERLVTDGTELRETRGCFLEGRTDGQTDGRTGGLACRAEETSGEMNGGRGVSSLPSSLLSWAGRAGRRGRLLTADPGRARRAACAGREADLGWPGGCCEARAHLHPGRCRKIGPEGPRLSARQRGKREPGARPKSWATKPRVQAR